jgi:diguanylate cyclase (GGDEF)-like protein
MAHRRDRVLSAVRTGLGLDTLAVIEPGRSGTHWLGRLLGSGPGLREGSRVDDLGAASGVLTTGRPTLLTPVGIADLRVPYASKPVPLAGAMAAPLGEGLVWADRAATRLTEDEYRAFVEFCAILDEDAQRAVSAAGISDQVDVLSTALEGVREILPGRDEATVVQSLVEAAVRVSEAEVAVVAVRAGGDEAVVVGGAGEAARGLAGHRFDAASGMTGLSMRTGSLVPSGMRYAPSAGPVLGSGAELPIAAGDALILHPVGSAPDVLACLVLVRGRIGRPSLVHAIRTLCDVAAVRIRQLRLQAGIAHEATIDPLTGMYNKRVLMTRLSEAVALGRRQGTPTSVLLMDADHFKQVNDVHGHPTGDAVLRFISDTVRRNLRESDTAGRYGGEEFVIVLPATDTVGATVVAERIRNGIGASPVIVGNLRLAQTISIGVSTWNPGMRGPEDLVAAADEAMYEAKRTGRNRVVVKK